MTRLHEYNLWDVSTACPSCGTLNQYYAKDFHLSARTPFRRNHNYEVMCGLCDEGFHFELPAINQGNKVTAVKVKGDIQSQSSGFKLYLTLSDCNEYGVGIVESDTGELEAFKPNDEYVVVPHGDNDDILRLCQRAYNDPSKVIIAQSDILNVRYELLQGQAVSEEPSMVFEPVTG